MEDTRAHVAGVRVSKLCDSELLYRWTDSSLSTVEKIRCGKNEITPCDVRVLYLPASESSSGFYDSAIQSATTTRATQLVNHFCKVQHRISRLKAWGAARSCNRKCIAGLWAQVRAHCQRSDAQSTPIRYGFAINWRIRARDFKIVRIYPRHVDVIAKYF